MSNMAIVDTQLTRDRRAAPLRDIRRRMVIWEKPPAADWELPILTQKSLMLI